MSKRRGQGLLVGSLVSIAAIVGVIALVGYLVAGVLGGQDWNRSQRLPIHDDVPPRAATPAPEMDLAAGGRTALQLHAWAQAGSEDLGIPVQALMAYGQGEVYARYNLPDCNLTWNTLAAIGFVETHHGAYNGKGYGHTELDDRGNVVGTSRGDGSGTIVGPQLNGDGFAEVGDTDDGTLDGDKDFDRAVGPMQFIPEAWRMYGADMGGGSPIRDYTGNPQNIDDAAVAAARLLCSHERDLSTPEGWTSAVRGYNQSNEYMLNVRDAAANYALGQRAHG
ncbi:hypothetical protein GC425_02790 [Corynebacterium sp. zg254]|uniref:Transglycosylase SLT domain-containing protein n=1 Tax=Corynebacterium zhongnanshanii TaxID=2768834 RepID=A0ABQ6VFE4_9CORY|nr:MULTISPECIES: hypothetical protein [Corynebacterium]KAB3523105.1 hypothetical protein F8377_02835 [Corynebacterium zhongnanshanii]MCR5913796.1 hypothetical protein [Corynebacterium sp. zg254]